MLLLAIFVLPQFANSQTVSTFEELELDSTGYWNGSDDAGGFTSGNAYFINHYNHDYYSWTGFAYSNLKDTVTAGYSNQYSAYAGIGADSSNNYCVAYTFGNDTVTLTTSTTVSGAYFTNNTYAALSMRDGDDYAKKFGGENGNDPDWFKLSIFGIDDSNNNTDTINFYLADFRYADNDSDYIVKDWKWADFTSLGNVKKIVFFLSSTDNGAYGMNTPAYFCLDNLNGTVATLSDLTVDGTTVAGFNANTLAYTVELPYGTTVVPTVVGIPTDANANVVVTDAAKLPGTTTVDVTAEDGATTLQYTINFTVTNNETDIIAYSFAEQTYPATINATAHTVDIEVASDTDVTTLIATFTLSVGATADINGITQVSSTTSNDFTTPITYTITAEDETTTQDWIITVTKVLHGTDVSLSDLTIDGTTVTDFNADTLAYTVELLYGTTVVPTVVGTPTDVNANVVVTDAAELPGTTTVDVTAEDGTTTLQYSIAFTVGQSFINGLSINELTIYPNPSTGIFFIKSKKILNNTQLFIRDINGKLILSQKLNSDENKVDISGSHAGIYFIQMITENNKIINYKILLK